jgi:hypothetical protein
MLYPRAGKKTLSTGCQEVFELTVGLALDRHSAEVADIAFVVAAGIKRQDVARSPDLV